MASTLKFLVLIGVWLIASPANAADCATLCRVEHALCMEKSKSIGDQKACKDQLQACEDRCESLSRKDIQLNEPFPEGYTMPPEDPEFAKLSATADSNKRWYCKVWWDFGFSDSWYEGWGPTQAAAIGNAKFHCNISNIIPKYKSVCGRKPKDIDCKDSGA